MAGNIQDMTTHLRKGHVIRTPPVVLAGEIEIDAASSKSSNLISTSYRRQTEGLAFGAASNLPPARANFAPCLLPDRLHRDFESPTTNAPRG